MRTTLLLLSIILVTTVISMDVPWPKLTGDFGVGIQTLTLRDTSRYEKLIPEGSVSTCSTGTWRVLPTMLYYPIE